MRPLLFFLWALFLAGVAGCGNKETAGEEAPSASTEAQKPAATQLPPADVTSEPGTSLIKDDTAEPAVEGLYINPYFDEEGTATRRSVAVGEQFELHIFAETIDPYSTSAAQYRIDLPSGIRVLGLLEFPDKGLSIGSYDQNYMIAFRCQPPGRFRMVTYQCVAEPDFRGGDIAVRDGVAQTGIAFIGFATCEYINVRGTGGIATLDLKQ